MTVSCVETTKSNIGAARLVKFWEGFGALFAVSDAPTCVDEMSEGQLEEIGMQRIAQRARWMDFRETTFGGQFEYCRTSRNGETNL